MFADIALSRRVERAYGRMGSAIVDARKIVSPELNPEWIEVAGARVLFDGVHRKTQRGMDFELRTHARNGK